MPVFPARDRLAYSPVYYTIWTRRKKAKIHKFMSIQQNCEYYTANNEKNTDLQAF